METRPAFGEIKSFSEFSKYYWYREELKSICKELQIDSSGMKTELLHNIEAYFKGNPIPPQKRKKQSGAHNAAAPSNAPLSLNSSLLGCNFSFNQRFRDFFAKQTGLARFKFNSDMVASVKKVKEDEDHSFTLGDLLDIFYGKKRYASYDTKSLQWNKFVKDFCADPETARFPNKFKTAASLWKRVRDSTREKVYTHELLEEFKDEIV